MNQYITDKQADFSKSIEHFKKEISSLRTGRASANLLEGVLVEAYGVKTPLQGLAAINAPDGQSLLIAPWDKNILKDVEKAVTAADLGVGIVNEGDKIRLTIPKMTEENRRELVRKLNQQMEDARISLRQVREEVKENIEAAEADKEISEDDKFRFIKELDEEMGKRNDELKTIRDKKEKEIMTI
ncbi:MAG: ribosome recycling factor [Planctomycetes bacterium]|nr:ribosome recycling factor [Planctomycetota bacterium]